MLENNISGVADVYSLIKESFKDILQELMEANPPKRLSPSLWCRLPVSKNPFCYMSDYIGQDGIK